MKNYTVNLEVILAGCVDVEAESQAKAIEIAKKQILICEISGLLVNALKM